LGDQQEGDLEETALQFNGPFDTVAQQDAHLLHCGGFLIVDALAHAQIFVAHRFISSIFFIESVIIVGCFFPPLW